MEAARDLGLHILALQEVRRAGDETLCFDGTDLEGWQFVHHGQKKRGNCGVGFILSPDVELVEVHPHWNGRLLSIRAVVAGMRIAVTCVYSPTEVAVVSAKSQFHCELRKAILDLNPDNLSITFRCFLHADVG